MFTLNAQKPLKQSIYAKILYTGASESPWKWNNPLILPFPWKAKANLKLRCSFVGSCDFYQFIRIYLGLFCLLVSVEI